MNHFGFEEIINEKKRKVKRISQEGWKFQTNPSKKTTWFGKLKKKITTAK
ncbi:hypothetical protein [Alkalihalobacillus sp. BA299]|nr:hypothetical protein [Alkalihalobacillus sp. BA299]